MQPRDFPVTQDLRVHVTSKGQIRLISGPPGRAVSVLLIFPQILVGALAAAATYQAADIVARAEQYAGIARGIIVEQRRPPRSA